MSAPLNPGVCLAKKLTSSFLVDNEKIKKNLNIRKMPYNQKSELINTIKSI